MQRTARTRLAVVGGGIASLAALFELTDDPTWCRRHEVTLYQMGWRLGGKGASGRNAEVADRIEEHGLHVWFGGYHNAFRLLRRCYAELGRGLDHPMPSVESAFSPARHFTCMEQVDGRWQPWRVEMPLNDKRPGVDVGPFDIWDATLQLVRFGVARFVEACVAYAGAPPGSDRIRDAALLRRLRRDALRSPTILRLIGWAARSGFDLDALERRAIAHLVELRDTGRLHTLRPHLNAARAWLHARLPAPEERTDVVRRTWTMLDLGGAIIEGLIADDVFRRGFAAIDHLDFRAWLARYAHTPEATTGSELVRVFYSVSFHHDARHTFEAGTALQGAFRLLADYHGAYFYRMRAGMGDVVFAPLYEVLRRRGVRFAFFHRVEGLHLDGGEAIERISVVRQVRLAGAHYAPLVDVGGLECWPAAPVYDQIHPDDRAAARATDLESNLVSEPTGQPLMLRRGEDFDTVLLGAPLPVVARLCPELVDRSPRWRRMAEAVRGGETIAAQLWLRPGVSDLADARAAGAMYGTHGDTYDNHCDLSGLIDRERWSDADRPGHLVYLCGAMPPECVDVADPDAAAADLLTDYLAERAPEIWTRLDRVDPALLVDPESRTGAARLASQYVRANTKPSDLYTLSVAGSSAHRMAPGDTGVANLVVTGDWTKNAFNCGCIEASVMSGLLAARALGATRVRIFGEAWTRVAAPRPAEARPRPWTRAARAVARVLTAPVVRKGADGWT